MKINSNNTKVKSFKPMTNLKDIKIKLMDKVNKKRFKYLSLIIIIKIMMVKIRWKLINVNEK